MIITIVLQLVIINKTNKLFCFHQTFVYLQNKSIIYII